MKNLKVATKLILGFSIMILLAVVVGAVGIFGMNTITAADTELYEENAVAVGAMGEIRENLQAQRAETREFIIYSGNEAKTQEILTKLRELEAAMVGLMNTYEATITDEAEETAYFNAKKIYENEYVTIKQRIAEASAQSIEAGIAAIADPTVAANTNSMVNGFSTSMANNNRWAKEKSDANDQLALQMTIIEIAVLVFAVIVALFLAFYNASAIAKPLSTMTAYLNTVSETGNMSLRPEDEALIATYSANKDETGQCVGSLARFVGRMLEIGGLLETVADGDLTSDVRLLSDKDSMGLSLKKMIDGLNTMFSEINAASAQVSIGSSQIADGAQSLAQGSTEQASAIQELSASISEIAEKTKQNANIAREASELSGTIKDNAEKGSSQMENMMRAVKDINDASNQIEKVIKIIDDIAFQTNILALNAAVEAARAGSAGKGFAVVAEEVRNLAAKSAEAAKDTGGLIENSIAKADLGLSIATETSASLKDIVEGVNHSAEIVDQITSSSDEQAHAIDQVNIGIDQVSQVVQQNSATAEQSAAASEEMSGQSNMLSQLISQFKLKNAAHHSFDSGSHRKSIGSHESVSMDLAGDGGYGKY